MRVCLAEKVPYLVGSGVAFAGFPLILCSHGICVPKSYLVDGLQNAKVVGEFMEEIVCLIRDRSS